MNKDYREMGRNGPGGPSLTDLEMALAAKFF